MPTEVVSLEGPRRSALGSMRKRQHRVFVRHAINHDIGALGPFIEWQIVVLASQHGILLTKIMEIMSIYE